MKVNELLKLARKYLLNVTAIELSSRIKVSQSYVSEIENEKKEPSLLTIQKYAQILKVPLWALFFVLEELSTNKFRKLSEFKKAQEVEKIIASFVKRKNQVSKLTKI